MVLPHGPATHSEHDQHADEMLKTARTRQHHVGCAVPATCAQFAAILAKPIDLRCCVHGLFAAAGHGGRANVACAPAEGLVGSSAGCLRAPMQLLGSLSLRSSGLTGWLA